MDSLQAAAQRAGNSLSPRGDARNTRSGRSRGSYSSLDDATCKGHLLRRSAGPLGTVEKGKVSELRTDQRIGEMPDDLKTRGQVRSKRPKSSCLDEPDRGRREPPTQFCPCSCSPSPLCGGADTRTSRLKSGKDSASSGAEEVLGVMVERVEVWGRRRRGRQDRLLRLDAPAASLFDLDLPHELQFERAGVASRRLCVAAARPSSQAPRACQISARPHRIESRRETRARSLFDTTSRR